MFRKQFNKRRNSSVLIDKAAFKIAAAINQVQRGFANFLNKRTKTFSVVIWKILLVTCCTGWTLYCSYIFYAALMRPVPDAFQCYKSGTPTLLKNTAGRKDSLAWMEKIYVQRNSMQRLRSPGKAMDSTQIINKKK